MSTMVSARVEDEIAAQANDILAQLGSSPTQLVNAAYKYVIEKRALPTAAKNNGSNRAAASNKRTLTKKQAAHLHAFFESAMMPEGTLPEDALGSDGTEYDALIAAALREDYESIR